jgi:hypothetical protein
MDGAADQGRMLRTASDPCHTNRSECLGRSAETCVCLTSYRCAGTGLGGHTTYDHYPFTHVQILLIVDPTSLKSLLSLTLLQGALAAGAARFPRQGRYLQVRGRQICAHIRLHGRPPALLATPLWGREGVENMHRPTLTRPNPISIPVVCGIRWRG